MEDLFCDNRIWAENALQEKLKGVSAEHKTALKLLRALMSIPADLQTAEMLLRSGVLTKSEIEIISFVYTDFCWGAYHDRYIEDLSEEERYDLMLNPDPSPDFDKPGADMTDVYLLLLRYGLDPNAVYEGETLLDSVIDCCNGYSAADTVQVLLDHGADPVFKPEGEETVFERLDFDIIFGAFNQSKRRFYDSWIHCWFVLIAFLHNEYKGKEIVSVYSRQLCDCELSDFKIEDLKEHRNYGFCLTNVPGNGENWSLHIFDRRTGWEVARL